MSCSRSPSRFSYLFFFFLLQVKPMTSETTSTAIEAFETVIPRVNFSDFSRRD